MIGLNMRSTLDIDTTIKDIPVNKGSIKRILNEILSIDLDDNINFHLKKIRSIREVSEYDDFRASVEARFSKIRVNMKIDITTGDVIIPKEVDYSFELMFEERDILVRAYNLETILAEKIESILARNISNTRARDYYDVYILLTLMRKNIDLTDLRYAINEKAKERNTLVYLENRNKYLTDIEESENLKKIWDSYSKKYPYAKEIKFKKIINVLREILN